MNCPFCNPWVIGLELVFSVVVIALCLMIFFRTKELYRLTKHRGISYFRMTFLFFALAFFFRFLFHLFAISGMVFEFHFPRGIMGPLPLLVTTYFSTIAIFYLLLSLLWKKVNPEHFLAIAHVAAFSVSMLVFVFRTVQVLAAVQLLLVACALLLAFIRSKHSKGFSKLFVIYVLLFIGWIANVIVLSPRLRIPFEISAVLYGVSVLVFSIIFYKVYRWTK